SSSGFRVSSSGFRVSSSGFRVSSSGFRVSSFGFERSKPETRNQKLETRNQKLETRNSNQKPGLLRAGHRTRISSGRIHDEHHGHRGRGIHRVQSRALPAPAHIPL